MQVEQVRDIREMYAKQFPQWTQRFWTWFTGKAIAGQQPRFTLTAWPQLAITLFFAVLGVVLGIMATDAGGWYFATLPLCWIMALAGARKLAATLIHQCVHFRFSGNKKVDLFVGEVITTLLCSQDAHSYQVDHCQKHHRREIFATDEDPIVEFLDQHGFKAGMSKSALWSHLLLTLISPIYHAKFLLKRLSYNFVSARFLRRLASVIFFGSWATLVATNTVSLSAFLLGYVVPIGLLYNVSVILEMLSEHAWLIENSQQLSERDFYAKRCWGRFSGEAIPANNIRGIRRLFAWCLWTIKMIGYHLIARLTVVTGDLPQHDYHHRRPGCVKWYISAYTRRDDIEGGHKGWIDYQESWGLAHTIDQVFTGLSESHASDNSSGMINARVC